MLGGVAEQYSNISVREAQLAHVYLLREQAIGSRRIGDQLADDADNLSIADEALGIDTGVAELYALDIDYTVQQGK